ncbi:hypothetical protein EON63_13525 [archaeon]|nr:MAG: hypothetical protein EON63_13525 [archaeon]
MVPLIQRFLKLLIHLLCKLIHTSCRLSLSEQISIQNQTITLPQICQWYVKDFELNPGNTITASTSISRTILTCLLPFLPEVMRDQARGVLNKSSSSSLRYTPLEFTCRLPKQLVS